MGLFYYSLSPSPLFLSLRTILKTIGQFRMDMNLGSWNDCIGLFYIFHILLMKRLF